jgi:hypothetical protein
LSTIETVTDESRLREKIGRVGISAEIDVVFCGEAEAALVPKPLDD